MSDRWEWVEIIEPRTGEPMYANLITGECVWDPPAGVRIKKTDRNQWWELFDPKTGRFYYYNALTQQTAWHRPQHCDIIPLAKLQTLRQNTEVPAERHASARKEIATQTQVAKRDQRTSSRIHSSSSSQSSPHQLAPRHHSHSANRSHSRQSRESATQSPLVAGNGRRSRQQIPAVSSSSSTVVVNPGYEQQESPPSPSAPAHHSHQSPRPQRSLAGTRAPQLMRVRSPEDEVMFRASELQRRPTVLDGSSSSRGGRPCYDDAALVRANVMRSPLQPAIRSPFGVARPDGFAVGGNPTLESLYFANVAPPSPELWDHSTSPITVMAKPRAFPRTNPAYIGSRGRDGMRPSYRKIDVDQLHASSARGHRLIDDVRGSAGDAVSFDVVAEKRRAHRHEYSDSDTSHSSFGISRLQQADVSQGFPNISADQKVGNCRGAFSDSQGSLSHLVSADSLSSHGSSRVYVNSGAGMLSSPHDSLSSRDSPRRVPDQFSGVTDPRRYQLALHLAADRHSQSAHSTPTARVRVRRNSEPDYANLPIVTAFHPASQTGDVIDSLSHKENSVGDEQRSAESMQSGDSLSPVEFVKQHGTPNSLRSASTHNSTASNTSEGLPDQGFEDSDNSSIFSSPSPKSRQRANAPCPAEVTHNSCVQLRQRIAADEDVCTAVQQQASHAPLVSSSASDMTRPLSFVLSFPDDTFAGMISDSANGQLEIEQFLIENLNEHRKGLLGKTVPIGNMLTWTKNLINKPMIRTADKLVKKEAVEMFKLIQSYMGDRKAKSAPNCIALEIISKGWSIVELRDEIYIQLCRQTSDNPRDESLMRGWELLSICLSFFPPSFRFHACLDGYITRSLERTTDQGLITHFALHCQRRLDRVAKSGPKRGLRKPTLDEIDQALKSIFQPSMFGNTLDEIMVMQLDRFPDHKLPWIQTTLSEEVLRLNGACVEGIFRVPGDVDEVNALKLSCDQWIPPSNCSDPHTPASLLKLWYRELYEPLIPSEFYEDCVSSYGDVDACLRIVDSLPAINRLVLSYLIRFLQVFAAAENAAVTKMDSSNLAMVMAPNCLRCESDDPNLIFENTRKEMAFVRTLIVNMDTSFMDGVL